MYPPIPTSGCNTAPTLKSLGCTVHDQLVFATVCMWSSEWGGETVIPPASFLPRSPVTYLEFFSLHSGIVQRLFITGLSGPSTQAGTATASLNSGQSSKSNVRKSLSVNR
ncbi:hypothetical protein BJ085DRAFT_27964 [Dimargaris cristalligena]|uniref:Uncharacterized protein n=1 Tax=Dimargaris cristalligena TaxID=215637 RepID=A0A4P9ZQR4_9FUNG|nr:hypothetical protein BJ085DRAFT_27964 [Dimargaris cristalligena]|eukprot:RKP34982.1 hypothetical protein BJ085DRAFT_27964 [Dimargaris cristalligena]